MPPSQTSLKYAWRSESENDRLASKKGGRRSPDFSCPSEGEWWSKNDRLALEKGDKIFLRIFLSRRRIKLTYYNMRKKVQETKLSVIIEILFKILGSDLVQGSPAPNLTLKQP